MSARRIDQGMAATAAGIIPAEVSQDLRTRYRQLPALLHRAGLAATYAYVASNARRGDHADAYADVARAIRERLRAQRLVDLAEDATHRDVLDALGKLTAAQYARASREITALVGWLSRLADAAVSRDPAEADDRTDDGTDDPEPTPGAPTTADTP